MRRYLTYFFAFFSLPLIAQDYHVDFKSWNMSDGMSDRKVNDMLKDHSGFMWLCTRNGLNCFDGYTFRSFTKEKKQLPFRAVECIAEDNDNRMWVLGNCTECANDLAVFDPYEKKYISWKEKTGCKEDETFNFLLKFNDTTFFFGYSVNDYFFTWQPSRGLRKTAYPVKPYQRLCISDHSTFYVNDSAGNLYEISSDGKLMHTAHRTNIPEQTFGQFSLVGIQSLMPGTRRTYALNTSVYFYGDSADVRNLYKSAALIASKGLYTGMDSVCFWQGDLYAKGKLICRIDKDEGNIKDFKDATSALKDDRDLWVANSNGFCRLTVTKGKFRKYFYEDPTAFEHNSFRALMVRNNCLYALNEALGIRTAIVDSNTRAIVPNFHPLKGTTVCMAASADGTIATIAWTSLYTYPAGQTQPIGSVLYTRTIPSSWKLYPISPDSFLIGTSLGLAWLSLKTRSCTFVDAGIKYPELAKALVLDIIPGDGHRLWICANKGLYEFDPACGYVNRYSPADTGNCYLPSAEIQHMHIDAQGIYWIATANGLIRWDRANNTSRLYTREDGLSNSNIYAVYEDHHGRLWLSSDLGIMVFNKQTGRVQTYLVNDGITNNEFNRVSHTQDSMGNIYFGTLNGVTSFNPDSFADTEDEQRATLAVSSLVQFDGRTNKLVEKTGELMNSSSITLRPGDRFFNLNFSLLTFNDVIHTTYYWKIDGVDSVWNSMHEPTLRISGLPYGEWVLHIKAQGYDGKWGRNELSITIHVIKPLYLQTWFIIASIVFTLLIIFGIFKWRTYLLQKENIRLDQIVKEKTFALEKTINELKLSSTQKDVLMKEIHHRVKNNLQVISTLLSLQLSKIADKEARTSIEEGISRISSIALVHYHLYKGDQLTSIEVSEFTNELFAQVSSVYERVGQAVKLKNNVSNTLLDIDTALPLGLMLNELMTNSFKYAYNNCTDCKMDVTLTHTGHIFTMQYCDHGPGLPDGYDVQNSEGLGITILKSLSKQLGGDFSYSKTNSCFTIYFLDAQARKAIE